MYCKNCGHEMDELASICVKCGVPKGKGNSFCYNCGNSTSPDAEFCTQCGAATNNLTANEQQGLEQGDKSKIAAGLLGILLGVFGVHNFYLGYTTKGIIQVLLGTVGVILCGLGPVASAIWGLIEGIMILTGSIDKDGQGRLLKD